MFELFNIQGNDWDQDKLKRIFNQADAEIIAKIKVPQRQAEDFLAWPLEKSGIFSVRSAYSPGLQQRDRAECSASSDRSDGERRLWNKIWKGCVPPKVKVFT